MLNYLSGAAGVGRHDGNAAGHGLDDHLAKRLRNG